MSSTTPVPYDVALKDVNRWLDIKKIPNSKREKSNEAIEILTDAIQEGYLTIDEQGFITQKLKFPEQVGEEITELKYQPRVDTGTIQQKLKNSGSDIAGITSAYGSALTGKTTGIIKKMDTADDSILKAIVTFFF